MATISLSNIANGNALDATVVDNNFDTIANLVNGSIDNNNISSSGAIDQSKLATTTLGYTEVLAAQNGITTVVDLTNLSVIVTVPSGGRRIKITGYAPFTGNTTDTNIKMSIKEGSTELNGGFVGVPNTSDILTVIVISSFVATAGSHTYKLTAERQAGTGTINMVATTSRAGFIQVELV